MSTKPEKKAVSLAPFLTPLGAWALAFGSSVGWGSFVMPGTTFLPIAGPLGTVVGLTVGALVMLVIALNYHYLISRYPDAGGAFTYTKRNFGYDHGFLCAWFLVLTYTAIVWANATALPLIGRNLLGGLFQFGFTYEIAGFHVYLGEIMLAVASILLSGLICLSGRPAYALQKLMALILAVGVIGLFAAVFGARPEGFARLGEGSMTVKQSLTGALNVIALAPWAFVGFESISHSAEEFKFPHKHAFRVMLIAVITGGMVYVLLAILAAAVQPDGFANWQEYISSLGSLEGIEALPTFFAAHSVLGNIGSIVIGLAALGGIVTGLVGNYVASSRLIYSMAKDRMLPDWFGKLNGFGVPRNALVFLMAISVFIPVFGRTAISWIVDVTTVGAAIAYAYTSASALKTARREGNQVMIVVGATGLVASLLFVLYFLVPNMLSVTTLSTESYFILAAWSILGFAFFHHIFKRDHERRLGHSSVVWIVLLSLILFTSLVWVRQAATVSTNRAADQMRISCQQVAEESDQETQQRITAQADRVIEDNMGQITRTLTFNSLVQMALIVAALFFMFRIYSIMQKREKQMEVDKILAEESSRAKTSFLSNMSHEIRTPMNAIIGLDNIALKDPTLSPRTREQLEKIGSSAKHLLGLINDILDMSRIESGRMVLKNEEFAFRDFLDQINVMINGQCVDKGIQYECSIIGQTDDYYIGDDMKLKQILINILGNSVKFTSPPGTVTFTVEQIARFEGYCTLRFVMKDTGIGMDQDYLPKIFEAFSQENATTTNVYGGSGLGMAITKNIVEMMNGEIEVQSEKGVGSTFTVTVTMKASSRNARREEGYSLPEHLRALVVDDDQVACEHAEMVLNDIGVSAESCSGSMEALRRILVQREQGHPYDIVLTDFRMPDMDGIELTREIRAIDNNETAIVVLSGYNFDDITDKTFAAGADGLLSKPLFTDSLMRELRSILQRKSISLPEEETQDEAAAPAENLLAGHRVLVVEDMEINADIMIDLLNMEDVSAEHAMNGQIAVDMFAQHPKDYYDAILMDVRMPVMDGLTATKTIRDMDRPDAKTVPIIALTANAFDEDVQRSLQAGMNAHLNKPVEMERLYETLSKLIQKRKK